jgi:hypothetical protein
MGDNVKVRIDRGRIDIDEFFRVIGMEVRYEGEIETTRPILQRKRT